MLLRRKGNFNLTFNAAGAPTPLMRKVHCLLPHKGARLKARDMSGVVIVIQVTCVHTFAINLHIQLADNRATDVLDLMKEKQG